MINVQYESTTTYKQNEVKGFSGQRAQNKQKECGYRRGAMTHCGVSRAGLLPAANAKNNDTQATVCLQPQQHNDKQASKQASVEPAALARAGTSRQERCMLLTMFGAIALEVPTAKRTRGSCISVSNVSCFKWMIMVCVQSSLSHAKSL